MAKTQFFDTKNLLVSLKAVGVSIVTFIAMLLPTVAIRFLFRDGNLAISMVLGLIVLILELFAWGFFANKFWNWK